MKPLIQTAKTVLLVLLTTPTLAACGIADTASSAAVSNQSSENSLPSVSPPDGTVVRKVQWTSSDNGWMITDKGIWTTHDRAHTWTQLPLPAGVQAQEIADSDFLSDRSGWMALTRLRTDARNPADFVVFRTQDGGESWLESSLAPDLTEWVPPPGGGLFIDFFDEKHGWVMVDAVGSGAVDRGTLFHTTDGGASWSKVAAPSGQPVRFISPLDGWTTNVPLEALYITHDGGLTWEEQFPLGIPLRPTPVGEDGTGIQPDDTVPTVPNYSLPVFFTPTDGVLEVTLTGKPGSVRFYTTQNAGKSWEVAAHFPLSYEVTLESRVPTAIITPKEWLAFTEIGSAQRTTTAGTDWQSETSTPLLVGVRDVQFTSEKQGWAHTSVGRCVHGTNCREKTQLLLTEDGGQTWQPAVAYGGK